MRISTKINSASVVLAVLFALVPTATCSSRCYLCVECPGTFDVSCPLMPGDCSTYSECPDEFGHGPPPEESCPPDIHTCPDGSIVMRDESIDCNFQECDDIDLGGGGGGGGGCLEDGPILCPDGGLGYIDPESCEPICPPFRRLRGKKVPNNDAITNGIYKKM